MNDYDQLPLVFSSSRVSPKEGNLQTYGFSIYYYDPSVRSKKYSRHVVHSLLELISCTTNKPIKSRKSLTVMNYTNSLSSASLSLNIDLGCITEYVTNKSEFRLHPKVSDYYA